MIFGIDFDNTIVNYNLVFKKVFKLEKNIKKKNLNTKEKIKNYLIKNNDYNCWRNIQSLVYSKYLFEASLNYEILKLLKYLDKKKIKFYIISHKTIYPYEGDKVNLHKLSHVWLRLNIFNPKNKFKKKYKAYFETTKQKKIKRIKSLEITHFIDDLDEILKKLPNSINSIKFDNSFKFTSIKKKYITY